MEVLGTTGGGEALRLGIVPSKLGPPRLGHTSVSRSDLVDRLAAAESRCVVVHAPAGFGKTTLVRQWCEIDERAAAWITLDPGDDDPVVLLRHLVGALAGIAALPVSLARASERHPNVLARTLPVFAAEIAGAGTRFFLVLDDVHLVLDGDSLTVLDRLLESVPEGSVAVLVARTFPRVRMPRRLISGHVVELDADDLRMTDEEAAALVRDLVPSVDPSTLAVLVNRCEGWPAGLALGSLALRSGAEADRLAASLTAAGSHLGAYFHEELLDRLPGEDRTFLVRTSILEQLDGELCDELLDRQGSAADLERLAGSGNAFVTGLGDSRSFRYHHLFRDLLLAELRRTMPDEEVRLRRRASELLSARHLGDAAVSQALATGDRDFAGEVVYRELFSSLDHGRIVSLERWLAAFPPEAVRRSPGLALASAWRDVIRGRGDDIDRWLELTASSDPDLVMPDGGTLDVARSALVMVTGRGGVKATAEAASTIVEAGPQGSPWWPMGRALEAVCLYLAGDADPVALLTDAEFHARGFPLSDAVLLAQLAVVAYKEQRFEAAHELTDRALDVMRLAGLEELSLATMVHAAHALDAAWRRSEPEAREALAMVQRMIDTMGDLILRARIHVGLVCAEALLLLGDERDAAAELGTVAPLLDREPDAVVLHEWVDDLSERLDRRLSRLPGTDLTNAELRVLEQLPTHLSLAEIGDHLYVSRNTVKSHTVSIYRKLGVSSRSEAVALAEELGLLAPPRH